MKSSIVAILIAVAFIAGAILFTGGAGETAGRSGGGDAGGVSGGGSAVGQQQNNVSIIDGKQVIDLSAKGGFSPRKSVAKAGLPTVLKVTTNNTFDCSSSVRIPSLKIYKSLGPTGVVEFDLGVREAGVLRGSCGMGMYPFEIDFQV